MPTYRLFKYENEFSNQMQRLQLLEERNLEVRERNYCVRMLFDESQFHEDMRPL